MPVVVKSSVKMKLTKRILDFLNKDVSKLFKKEYDFKIEFIERDDKNRGIHELKRYDKKTGEEIPYRNFPPRAMTVNRGNLRPCSD